MTDDMDDIDDVWNNGQPKAKPSYEDAFASLTRD